MTKLYRTRQEFRYAPTGFYYAVGIEDPLDDWHPDDIKEALRNLIEEIKAPVVPLRGPTGLVTSQPESKQPAEGTPTKDTKELTNG